MSRILPLLSWGLRISENAESISADLERLSGAGIRNLNLEVAALRRCWEEPGFAAVLQKCIAGAGLVPVDVHAPHSAAESLGYPVPGEENIAVDSVKKSLRTAAELGVRTVTVHTARTRFTGDRAPGIEYPYIHLPQARERIFRQLDELLPVAEKMQIVIAVENLFLPSGTAAFLDSIIPQYDSPYLGYCYDSGHALLLEDRPCKDFGEIPGWIRCGWEDDTVTPQSDQLDIMLENIVTCHLHDNCGTADQHLLPGSGIADWKKIVSKLQSAPRLISIQSEIIPYDTAEVPLEEQLKSFEKAGFDF